MFMCVRVQFLVCFLVWTVAAQAGLTSDLPIDPTVKVGKLPNGLTYYIRKNSKPENKLELRLVVNAGSILERDDQRGVAHFLEHMAFNGTKSFHKNDLISYLQSIGVQFGADLNAYTTFDETVYVLPIPTEKPENVDKGLQIIAEWASAIELDPSEIERERGVVLEEMRLLESSADQRMRDRYQPKVFRGSKYAERLPIGTKESIKSFNTQAIVDFYEDWYRPDLMAIVAVGDVDPSEIEKKIQARFSGIQAKRSRKPRPVFGLPDHRETITAIETDKEAQTSMFQLIFKQRASAVKTKRDYRRELVKSVLSQMMSARLRAHMISDEQLMMMGGAGFGPYVRDKEAFVIYGVADPEKARRVLSTIFRESRRARELGFSVDELEDEKGLLLDILESRYNERQGVESSSYAKELVEYFLNGKPIPGPDFEFAFVKAVMPTIKSSEINSLAKETLAAGNQVLMVAGQEKMGVSYPSESEISSLRKSVETAPLKSRSKSELGSDSAVSESGAKETGATSGKLDQSDSTATAKVVEERTDAKFGITYLTLSNGAKIVLRPDPTADRIVMKAFSPGGLTLVDDSRTLAKDFIAFENGIGAQYEELTKDTITGTASRVSTNIGDTHEYVNGSSRSAGLDNMLFRVGDKFKGHGLSKTSFNSSIVILRTTNAALSADPHAYFNQQAERLMTQDNPRARRVPETANLAKISLDQVNAIYGERFADVSDFTFIFAGNFENDRIKPLILKYLGSLPGKNSQEKWKDPGVRPPVGRIEKVFQKGLAPKSLVRLVFAEEAKYDVEDARVMDLLDDLLTIRLFAVLREERAGIYTVTAASKMFRSPYEGFEFTVEFPCGPENVSSLTDAAQAEIVKIREGKINDTDLNKVKAAMLLKARKDEKSSDHWASAIMVSLRDGAELNSLEEVEKHTNGVTAADIQRIAAKYLKIDQRKRFVLMPENAPIKWNP